LRTRSTLSTTLRGTALAYSRPVVDTARVKLITIIFPVECQDRLGEALVRLGAGGYTVSTVDGRGQSGRRIRGFFDVGNMRMETIVAQGQAEAILTYLAGEAETIHLVAFSQDVDAVPRKHFV
jgi:nitrogen regulatory protein PII